MSALELRRLLDNNGGADGIAENPDPHHALVCSLLESLAELEPVRVEYKQAERVWLVSCGNRFGQSARLAPALAYVAQIVVRPGHK